MLSNKDDMHLLHSGDIAAEIQDFVDLTGSQSPT